MLVDLDALDPAARDVHDAVRDGDEPQVVGDQHERLARLAADALEQLEHGAARLRVERAGGLVGQDEARVLGDGAGDGDALLLATRELGGEVVDAVRQAHAGEHVVDRQRVDANLARQLDVLARGEACDEVVELEDEAHVVAPVEGKALLVELRDVAPVEENLPRGGLLHAAEHVEHRGLAGPRRAHDEHEFAALELQVDAVGGAHGGRPLAVDLGDVAELDERHAGGPPCGCVSCDCRVCGAAAGRAVRPGPMVRPRVIIAASVPHRRGVAGEASGTGAAGRTGQEIKTLREGESVQIAVE